MLVFLAALCALLGLSSLGLGSSRTRRLLHLDPIALATIKVLKTLGWIGLALCFALSLYRWGIEVGLTLAVTMTSMIGVGLVAVLNYASGCHGAEAERSASRN